jgi:hypothetical protein
MIRAIELRIDPWGTAGAKASAVGPDQIEVLVPLATSHERIQSVKDRLSVMGRLEFMILANEKHDGELGNHVIAQARENLTQLGDTTAEVGHQRYRWLRIHDQDQFGAVGETPGESIAVQDGYVLAVVPDETTNVRVHCQLPSLRRLVPPQLSH